MAYLFFVDESGLDRKHCPYEVLAGAAVEDSRLWPLITQIREAELAIFGRRYPKELKAKLLLDRGTFKFASIVDCSAPRPASPGLRKDYSYLFERFYAFLDDISPTAHGIVVFDELERSKSHLLIGQMAEYFQRTAKGRVRAGRILPEPLFVHSDLTTLIMVADLLAYLIVFGVRIPGMTRPARPELQDLADAVLARRFKSESGPYRVWGFKLINDLRPLSEKQPVANDPDSHEDEPIKEGNVGLHRQSLHFQDGRHDP